MSSSWNYLHGPPFWRKSHFLSFPRGGIKAHIEQMCYHTTDGLTHAVLTHSGETQTNVHSPQAGHQWQIKWMLPFRSNLMGQWVQLELLTGFGLKGDLQKYTQLQGSKLSKTRLISHHLTAYISSECSSPQELHDKILMGSILCHLLWMTSATKTLKKTMAMPCSEHSLLQ